MKTLYLIFFTFLIFNNSYSQLIKIDNSVNTKENIEHIILQNKNFGKDTIRLKQYLSPLIKSNKKEFQALYYSLLAKGYSNAYEDTNIKSENSYTKAIELAKKNKGLESWILVDYAYYLYSYSKISEALKIFIDADYLINNINPKQIIFPSECFIRIGFFMGTIGDEKTAIEYLKKAKKYTDPNSKELATIKDNIGFYYLKLNDLKNAKKYFLDAKEHAFSNNNHVRYAKTLGNLALLSKTEKNYILAEKLIAEDIKISKAYKSDRNTMYALILQSRIFLNLNKLSDAKKSLSEAVKIANSKSQYKNSEIEIIKINLDIAIKENNTGRELLLRRELDQLEKNLINEESKSNLDKSKILVLKERYKNQLSLANSQFETEQFKNKSIIAIIALLLTIIIFVFITKHRQQKNRKISYEKTVLELELEKLKSEQKLDLAQNTLDSYKIYLEEKNKQIESLNKEINKVKNSSSFDSEIQEQQLQKLLESHLMTEDNWRRFRSIFELEHPNFITNLNESYPDLTVSNLRFLALQKLGLSNLEIASLLGITLDAVKKSKQRLRKKLGEEYETIIE